MHNQRKVTASLPMAGQTTPPPLLYWVSAIITPIRDHQDQIIGYVASLQDITAEVQQEKERAFEQETAELKAAVSRTLQEQRPLAEKLHNVIYHLMALESVQLQERGGIFLADSKQSHLTLYLQHQPHTDDHICLKDKVPYGDCLCGRAAVSGQLLVSDHCFEDTRHEYQPEGIQPHGHYIVPLVHGKEVLGVLNLYTDPYPSRHPAQLAMLQHVGELVGLAIANERLREEREKAREASFDQGTYSCQTRQAVGQSAPCRHGSHAVGREKDRGQARARDRQAQAQGGRQACGGQVCGHESERSRASVCSCPGAVTVPCLHFRKT